MGICFFSMTAKIEGQGMLKETEIHKSTNRDSSFMGLSEHNDSEVKWVKLHQMFDR